MPGRFKKIDRTKPRTITINCSEVFDSVADMQAAFETKKNWDQYYVEDIKTNSRTGIEDIHAKKQPIRAWCKSLKKNNVPYVCDLKFDLDNGYFLSQLGCYKIKSLTDEHYLLKLGIDDDAKSISASKIEYTTKFKEQIAKNCRKNGRKRIDDLRKMVETIVNSSSVSTEFGASLIESSKKWKKPKLCKWLSFNEEVPLVDIPEEFLCSIEYTLMTDPVVLPSGHSIDFDTFNKLTEDVDPFSREDYGPDYKPPRNHNLRYAIERFLQKYGGDIDFELVREKKKTE